MRKFIVTVIFFSIIIGFNLRLNKYTGEKVFRKSINAEDIINQTPRIEFFEYFRNDETLMDNYDFWLLIALEKMFGPLPCGDEDGIIWVISPIDLREID